MATSTSLRHANQLLMEIVADAVPGINVDFSAEVVELGHGRYTVNLKALNAKGHAYLPYLSEYIKLKIKESREGQQRK